MLAMNLGLGDFRYGGAVRKLSAVAGLLLFGVSQLSAHEAHETCPPPAGYQGNPLSKPSITAAEVVADPTATNLRDFAVAARDYLSSITTQLELAYASCLMRLEDGDWRSGEISAVSLSVDPAVFADPQAPIHMRVLFHSADMATSGRLLKESAAKEILAAAASDQASGGAVPSVACLALDCPQPGVGGHAVFYGPFILLAGAQIEESHFGPEVLDIDHTPDVSASEVVDRPTLRAFVNGAIDHFEGLVESLGFNSAGVLRGVLRDENGPWRAGPVYLFIIDRTGYTLFHGAFPDKYEFKLLTGTVLDAVTGEAILPQVISAATQSDEGGFVEYHFDNPDDDSDNVDVPKLAFVRERTITFRHPVLGEISNNYIIGSGLYQGEASEGGATMTSGCSDHNIAASAVRTQNDIRAFVNCAAEYLAEHGTAEARRAFNEDERWKHGPTYVFVDGIAKSGTDAKTFVYPPDPSREGGVWGEAIDDFGNDLFYEIYRMTQAVDAGWTYYSFPNPATGKRSAKASYIIEIDWDGEPAVIGAGIYSRDWPGTCYADEVNAATLSAAPSAETLREFVRCAALVVEAGGYFAKREIERDPRWTDGENYLFVLDMLGNQVMSGQPVRVNGRAPHEWGRGGPRGDQFGGRNMAEVGGTFGESYVYYRSYNPMTGTYQPKVGFLKRVVAQGVPLLVGAGYPAGPAAGPSCTDNYVTAAAVRTQSDLQAFVQCAAEYVQQNGEEEARRAFNEDARWKSGPTYVFVDEVQPSGETALAHVFPPEPSREGSVWGTSIDSFGSDYYYELHRILSAVDEGWIYYAFTNPETGRSQPKSSYVKEIEWNGDRAAIGAGIYSRDFPGACDPSEVNAADLAANPGDRRLQELVRCAALEVESSGYFAGPVLSSDPRWKHGPIYIFGIDPETVVVEFSGNPASFAVSRRAPYLLFDGRDVYEAAALFGESFFYFNFNNPATGQVEPKTAFYKLVRAQGVPLLVGSGYNP
ncbi:MAG: hypothetical protein OXN96_17000 [Bryobacterales bacterium]|nr:hypothetical protein [Bryobacterales bacterium]